MIKISYGMQICCTQETDFVYKIVTQNLSPGQIVQIGFFSHT
uniref:Uncharacterized protein n=1 Tax=Anguilla anguilla TaxID=7936 RepID=A0A0E9WAV2_ANGAN